MTRALAQVACITACLLAVVLASGHAEPVGTAFTYQGKLTDSSGNPVSGTRDMTFKLFGAPTDGNQIGTTVTKTGVAVAGGLFTLQLDFGPGAFSGEKRWLDTAIGGETISPRVELATPPGPLQMQVSELVNQGYVSGIVSVSHGVTDCTQVDRDGQLECYQRTLADLAVVTGHPVNLILTYYPTEGDPIWREVTIEKIPRSPALTAKAFDVRIRIISPSGGIPDDLFVSPDDPVLQPPSGEFGSQGLRKVTLVNDSLVQMALSESAGVPDIMPVTNVTRGVIIGAHIEPYLTGAREVELQVRFTTVGDISATYIVAVTNCGPSVEPVMPRVVTIPPQEEQTLSFTLRATSPFSETNTCTLKLKSANGKEWDSVRVLFPAPTGP